MNETVISAKLLAEYRAKLEEMLQASQSEAETTRESRGTVMLDQQSIGRLSRMDAIQQQAMANAAQSRRLAHQSKIAAALKRMEEDEFGYCVECGEPIAGERLDLDPAIPTGLTCARG